MKQIARIPHKLDSQGFAHYILPLFAVLLIAIVGSYLTVASNAASKKKAPKKPAATQRPATNPWTSQCPGNRIKFGTPRGSTATTAARQKVFGNPYPNANVESTSFMGHPMYIHKKVLPCLKAAEWDLRYKFRTHYKVNAAYGASELNSQNPSNYFHAYGAAIDINPAQNPQCADGCGHTMPDHWVRAFKAHGFYWGGDFPNNKDYMHFEWHGQL